MAKSRGRARRAPKTKAPNGAGTVFQRKDGRWCAELVTRDELGRRWRRGFYAASEKEARAKLIDAQHALRHGLAQPTRVKADSDSNTVAAYLAKWLDNLAVGGKSAGTMRKYRQLTRDYIEPSLGHLELPKVTSDHVQAFYRSLAGRLSSSSIEVVHAILHGAFRKAVASRPPKMLYNPASLEAVNLPRHTDERKEPAYLSNAQAAALLTAAATGPFARWRAAFTLLVMTGLRRGELLALKWDDVDMAARTISIGGSLKPIEGGGMGVGATKTRSGRRVIVFGDLEPEAWGALEVAARRA